MSRFLLFLSCVFFSFSSFAADIFVDQSAAPGGDGSTWLLAFQTVEEAVATAASGDTIFIAEGIYQPENEIDINVPLTIRGGFPQGGGVQNINTHATQIQADFDPGNLLFRVFDIGTSSDCLIEGVRFYNTRYAIESSSNITVDQVNFELFSSFGVRMADDVVTCSISNSIFSDFSGTAVSHTGIINNLTITNTIFQKGTATAISIDDEVQNFNFVDIIIRDFNSSNRIVNFRNVPNAGTISNFKAYNNTLTSSGSIFLISNSNVSFTNAEFVNNNGQNGTPCIQTGDATVNIDNSTFFGNSIIGSGPKSVFLIWDTEFTVTNSKFENNHAQGTFSALADIRADDTDALTTFENCLFKENSTLGSSQQGIIDASYDTNILINNCVFDANSSPGEFVVASFAASGAVITNNTFMNHSVGPGVLSIDYVERGAGGGTRIEGNTFLNNIGRTIDFGRMTDFIFENNKYYGDTFIDIANCGIGTMTNDYFEGNDTGSRFMVLDEVDFTMNNTAMISTQQNGNHRLINSSGDVSLNIINSTFSATDFNDTNVSVGFNADLQSTVRNTVIWSGSDLSQSGFHGNTSNIQVRYSLVKSENPAGAGNLNGNQAANAPVFLNPENGDFREQRCSPTVNAGNNSYTSETTDLNGDARVFQTTIDMGAYELQSNQNASCTAPALPDCATLTTPTNGQTNIAIDTNLNWPNAARADGYRITAGTTSGGTDILDNVTVFSSFYDFPFDFEEGETIYVTLTSFNETGEVTCTEESFTIITNTTTSNPPSCSALTDPFDGETDVEIDADISWNSVSGADGYLVTVGSTSGGNDIRDAFDVGDLTTYDLPVVLPENSEIFVTIEPYNSAGNATGCAERSFFTTTASTPPNCTTLITPADGATDIAVDLASITWNSAPGATQYRITVDGSTSNANDVTDLVVNGTTYTFTNNFDNGETVTVTIVPFNTDGDATGCAPETFTIAAAAPTGNAFITTWETTTANESITIPTFAGETYDYTVDWGDGTINNNITGDATHTYVSAGTYTVSITGTFPQIYFNGAAVDRDKILTVEQWGDIEWLSMQGAFYGCSRLDITNPAIDVPNLSLATDIGNAFRDCTNFNGDVTQWNVSNITNMTGLFRNATIFNQNIGSWNVSNVTGMARLFESASAFDQDIGAWDVSSATSMAVMFANATNFNQNIGGWDVSNVVDMNTMLYGMDSFNQDIGNWNVSNVQNMNQMFMFSPAFNQDISFKPGQGIPSGDAWNTGNVTTMIVMFYNTTSFNQDIGNWNVSSVTNMSQMLRNATSFDQDISAWDVSGVTDANNMLAGATLSTANYDALLIGWNAQNLQPNVSFHGGNSQYCAGEAARTNIITSDNWTIIDGGTAAPTVDDIANQNQANSYTLPTITGTQLTGAEAYYTEPNGGGTQFNIGDVINFADFPSYPVTLYIYDGSGICDSEESFELLLTNTSGNLPFITTWETTMANETITVPTFNTETYDYDVDWGDGNIDTNVNGDATHTYTTPGIHTVSITGIFPRIYFNNAGDKDKLLTIEQWGNIEWASMESAFYGCTNLNITNPSIDAPDLTRVTSLENTFRDTWQFNGMVNDWNTENVTTLRYMFGNSFLFNQDISNWDVRQVENMSFMFSQASFNQSLNNWQTDSLVDLRGMFSRASAYNQPMDNWNVDNVTIMFGTFSEASSFNQDLSTWNVSNVTTMRSMFDNALAFNQDISGWNVVNVTEMRAMFRATPFNQDISGWDVGNVTTMQDMFVNATNFDQNLGSWDVSSLSNASSMFSGVQLSTANYDALLIGWNTRALIADVVFDGGNSLYCNGAVARSAMTRNDNWTITDGGTTGPEIESIMDQNSADNFTFPTITGTQLTGGEAYYTEPNGGGTRFDTGDVINFSDFPSYPVTLYIYDSSGSCFDEESFALNITSAVTTPTCTTLANPINEDTNVSIATDISWNAITGADGYRLTIGTTTGGNDILDNVDVGNLLIYNPPNDLPSNTEIFVSVVPYIGTENATGCTEESFTTEIAQPGCANLITPTFDATDVPVNTNLTWNMATNAVRYSVAIGTATGLDDILTTTDVGNNTTFDPPADLPANTRVFVTITSFNAADESVVCGDDQFTTGNRTAVLPDCTALSSPLDGDANVSVDTDISWQAVANADGYRLTVGTSPGGNDVVDNFDAGNVLTFDFSGPFTEGTTVYVSITPYNMDGDAENCSGESFTIAAPLPNVLSCTSLATPLNGAIDVEVDTNIAWNEVLNADGYRLSIGTTARGSDILDNEDVGILTSYQLPNALPFEQQIFVTITPYNADGDAENCEEQSFITISEVTPEVESLNGLSPDGDGINEFWRIEGIEEYPNNTVVIYNRWGDMVYKVEGYNNTTNTFNGEANQLNGLGASQLPEGTYFFNIIIPETNNNLKQTKGYLVLKR